MSARIPASSSHAAEALGLVEALQARFVEGLDGTSGGFGVETPLVAETWLRDGGRHGGGARFGTQDTDLFDRASINVSQVHYDDDPAKKLGSATALSCIVHPQSPQAPSVHVHISWTELRGGRGYWRLMADLNPSLPSDAQKQEFAAALRAAAPAQYEEASAQGDRYFWIPALERHRGVTHFYLEGYATSDRAADLALARRFGEAAIRKYLELLREGHARDVSDQDRAAQLAYHTLYLFQVLTLDRGTSSGLLVHDQNDVGILGSLPGHIDPVLLASWRHRLVAPQTELLDRILAALAGPQPCPVTASTKRELAAAVREHYRAHPEALGLQAAGDVLPPTVDNHL